MGVGTLLLQGVQILAATRVDENGLIEKGRENLVLQSNQFDTTWTSAGSTITDGQLGYDGSNNAWLLESTNTGQSSRIQSISQSGVQTASVYAKAGTTDWMFIYLVGSTDKNAWFDLSSGSLGSTTGIDSSIESVGNGWYRCSVSYSVTISSIRIYVSDGNNNVSSSLGANILIQDAQLELGLVATDYIETTTTTAQAGILEDMPRLDYSGGASCPSLLLEPQRTNLVVNSEYFGASEWNYNNAVTKTANAAISPEGLQNAYLITEDAVNGAHRLGQASWGQSVADTSVSVFAKANGRRYIVLGNANMSPSMNTWFDLENGVIGIENPNLISSNVEDFGNGWYRCSISYLPNKANTYPTIYLSDTDGATSYQGDGVSGVYLYGYQIEVGASYPTSYIPTYGTSQTRSDDFMNISSLADEIDGNSFTYFLEINNEAVVRDSATGNISVGASGNRFFLYNDSSATARMKLYIQDVTTQSYQLSADNVKLVVRIEPNKVEVFENGVSVLSTTQNLDFSGNSSYVLRGATREMGIKQTAIFPTPLTDSECIALTTL
jgi:hypothetical protein